MTTKVKGINSRRGGYKAAGRGGVDVTWRGRALQVRAAAIRKARSPTTVSRVRRTRKAEAYLFHNQTIQLNRNRE